ncbi:glycoside hydrolase family 2 TIM barrel-domain containing protein [Maribacter sp. 2210JD10-5]|uniref:glycoside hydrolase family 2 TIM barrel-domain containing protein n=1 Tax=Maribacter sp. 2210JD10-5 TaxID=3386272 RepID=UPI0039BD8126
MLFLRISLISLFLLGCGSKEISLKQTDFNFDWQFRLIDSTSHNQAWKTVRLPHDWSVASSFDSIHGEGATGYLPGGIGEYEKQFPLNLSKDEMAFLLFDGVYNNAEVSLNGEILGNHPYGYSPFYYDITPHLNTNKDANTINVMVDRTRYADSRWYTGSGIYRNVELLVKNRLHIPIWGVYITTPKITKDQAEVQIEVSINNHYPEDKRVTVITEIFNMDGVKVGESSNDFSVVKEGSKIVTKKILVKEPILWSVDNPYLYTSKITISEGDKILDTQEIKFGIRSIRFDANEGFFLNGENMKIKGVCLHHDGGLVGAAVPKGVWERRLKKLKEGGCNAIRISHNPGSQEFLDLCDEMGFLVQDEFFDEWDNPKDKRNNMNEQSVDYITRGYTEHFQEWAERDLKNTVLAHRNHPSIIQWSIGNEIEWTYPRNGDATGFFNNMHWSGNYFWSLPPNSPEKVKEELKTLPKGKYDIGETAKKLANWTRELDTTRYIIANCILPTASHESGYTDALDMVGYSYRRVLYDYGHENYPDKPIMGTENLGQWHEWKAVMERPFISGTFLWTGIDYMGESNNGWPKKGSNSGLLDMGGFEKPSYHMFKSLWSSKPHVYLATQLEDKSIYKADASGNPVEKKPDGWKQALWGWHPVNEHWNYEDGETSIVEVYSNCDEVELFLNEKSLGTKKLSDFEDHIYKWIVPFREGTLLARGKKNSNLVETQIVTTSEPVAIQLISDKKELDADGYDVAHITTQLIDKNGNPVKTENHELSFNIDGEAELLGVDTGANDNVQDLKSNRIITDKGRCLLIIRSKKATSEITIKATSEQLTSNTIIIHSK